MRSLKSKIVAIATATTIGASLMAAPAVAGEPPNTYGMSTSSRSFAVCGSPNCPYGVAGLAPNMTGLVMRCYTFASNWPKGNYYSTMWFKVYVYGAGDNYFVHSSYVYKQATVGRC
jgi:hypothetical protein